MRKLTSPAFAPLLVSLVMSQAGAFPTYASETDDRIEESVENSYNFQTYLKDESIDIESTDGVVTLTGTVSSSSNKSLAEETVAGMAGVKRVNNELTITGDQPSDSSDAWISTKVKTVLAFRKNVNATDTNVQTQNGVVTLTGTAESEAQKQLATEYAKDVEGVREVRNNIVVTGKGSQGNNAAPGTTTSSGETLGEKVDDASITAQVKMNLVFHKDTKGLATNVTTDNGVVTLRGEARSAAEKDLVTKLAENVDGVKRVNNQMTVRKN